MQVNTISTSLHKQLSYDPEAKLGTQILNDVAIAISKVKRLINWLDLNPFQGEIYFDFSNVKVFSGTFFSLSRTYTIFRNKSADAAVESGAGNDCTTRQIRSGSNPANHKLDAKAFKTERLYSSRHH